MSSFLRCLPIRPLASALRRPTRITAVSRLSPRYFSYSHSRAALEEPANPNTLANLQQTRLFKDLQNHPELLGVLKETMQVLEEEGFNTGKPSMMKFLTNQRVRDQTAKVMKALQEAGIEMPSPQEAMEIMKVVGKEPEK